MAGPSSLPFATAVAANSGVTTALATLTKLDTFFDNRGRKFRLFQCPTSLTGTNTAAGDACYVVVPDKFTNTVASATGSSTTLIHAGAAPGIIIPSTSSITYYTLLLVEGRMTVNTVDSSGTAGDYLIMSTTNAKYTYLAQADTTTLTQAVQSQYSAGRILANASSGTADAFVKASLGT